MEEADVRGTFERLKAAGAIVIQEPYEMDGSPGFAIATLADPDGNYFQLTTPYESAGMGGGQDNCIVTQSRDREGAEASLSSYETAS